MRGFGTATRLPAVLEKNKTAAFSCPEKAAVTILFSNSSLHCADEPRKNDFNGHQPKSPRKNRGSAKNASHVCPEKIPITITAIISRYETMTSAIDKLYSNFIGTQGFRCLMASKVGYGPGAGNEADQYKG